MKHLSRRWLVALVMIAAGCTPNAPMVPVDAKSTQESAPTPSRAPTVFAATAPTALTALACASSTLAALGARDGQRLAGLADTQLGIRFTPFAFPSDGDVVLDVSKVRSAFTDGRMRDWGNLGESDDRIRMTFAQYAARFVYDVDFSQVRAATPDGGETVEDASWNVPAIRDELHRLYPRGVVLEYHHAGATTDPESWRVLRIVCSESSGSYRVVAILHSEMD